MSDQEAESGGRSHPGALGEEESGKNPVGRPTDFTQSLADSICLLIAEGKSLRKICEMDEYPDKSTVFRWLGQNTKFRDQYAIAREAQTDYMAEDILDIADDGTNDYGFKEGDTVEGASANPVFLGEHVQRSRLRVDARKWLMSKLAPKKYGDFTRNETDLKVSGQIIVQSSPVDEGL